MSITLQFDLLEHDPIVLNPLAPLGPLPSGFGFAMRVVGIPWDVDRASAIRRVILKYDFSLHGYRVGWDRLNN